MTAARAAVLVLAMLASVRAERAWAQAPAWCGGSSCPAAHSPDLRRGQQARIAGWSAPLGRVFVTVWPPGELRYSDDGVRWHRARWTGRFYPGRMAFDPVEGLHGVARAGWNVASTNDGGRTWTDHGGARGTYYEQVLVFGQASVLVDQRGRVWRSRNGGRYRVLVDEAQGSTIELAEDAIVVCAGPRRYRVLRDGNVQRDRLAERVPP